MTRQDTTMSSSTASLPGTEDARINLRTSSEAKALIERAAALLGTTVSAFMLQHAYEAARQILATHDTLILSQHDFDAFVAAGENPPEPNTELRRLLAR